MTAPDISNVKIEDAWRARLEEVGLAKAGELFPDDVKVAIATAIKVRDSFECLNGAVRA